MWLFINKQGRSNERQVALWDVQDVEYLEIDE